MVASRINWPPKKSLDEDLLAKDPAEKTPYDRMIRRAKVQKIAQRRAVRYFVAQEKGGTK